MPPDFDFPFGTQIWTPLALTQQQMNVRDVRNLQVLARLKENVSVLQAQAEMLSIAQLIEQQYPQTNTGLSVTVAIGLPAAYALGRVMSSMLFGIVTLEYAILIGFVIVLTAVALLSSFIPAWRATKVDPLVALRYE
jgi:hypothetical protein